LISATHRFLATILTLITLLIASGISWAAEPVVLVVGDSLSAAYGLREQSGWVHLLRERLTNHKPRYTVVNASISGDTTRGGLTRIDKALKQFNPQVVIIELGGNDGLRGMPLNDMRNNLDNMVSAVKQANATALIIGVEMPSNYGPLYTKQFLQVFQDVGRKHNVRVVPSIFAGFSDNRDFFQPDGIHPVASAQPIILETVWKELAPLLEEKPASAFSGRRIANPQSVR
jgi:acyl-CoA thioesterase I